VLPAALMQVPRGKEIRRDSQFVDDETFIGMV